MKGHGALALAAAGALSLGLVAGCTTARVTLGTNASPCFEALAVAADAVHGNGTFAGVHLVSFSAVGSDLHMAAALTAVAGRSVHDVCAVSYRGSFHVDQVKRPIGPAPTGGVGHYAIVIVSKPQGRLLGTVLRQTQPLRFGHPV